MIRKGLLKNFLTSLCLVLDLDECTTNSHTCDVNAVCQNTVGSHTCSCKAGYTGNGKSCYGKLEIERRNTSSNCSLKGQMNQNFDLFYFSSILLKCV